MLKRLSPNGKGPIPGRAAVLLRVRSHGADLGIEDTGWGPVGTKTLPYAAGAALNILGEAAVCGPAGEPQPGGPGTSQVRGAAGLGNEGQGGGDACGGDSRLTR